MRGLSGWEIVLIVVVLVVFASGIDYWQSRDHIRTIRGYLLNRGAVNVVVTWDWLGGDRGNQAFSIQYTDQHGRVCQTRCKISGWSGEIYWRDPPAI
jgi:hypothetical protein